MKIKLKNIIEKIIKESLSFKLNEEKTDDDFRVYTSIGGGTLILPVIYEPEVRIFNKTKSTAFFNTVENINKYCESVPLLKDKCNKYYPNLEISNCYSQYVAYMNAKRFDQGVVTFEVTDPNSSKKEKYHGCYSSDGLFEASTFSGYFNTVNENNICSGKKWSINTFDKSKDKSDPDSPINFIIDLPMLL